MKKILLLLSLATALSGFPAAAWAAPDADPQTVAAVRSMLDAMDMHQTMAATYAQMEQALPAMMKSQVAAMVNADPNMTAQQRQQAQDKMERMMSAMVKSMGAIFRDPALIDEMIRELVPVYANNFSTAEINELAAFYRTPAGRKMLTLMPKITTETALVSQKVIMPRMGKIMQDMVQELQKQ